MFHGDAHIRLYCLEILRARCIPRLGPRSVHRTPLFAPSGRLADYYFGYKYAPLPEPNNPQSLEEAFRRNPHNQTYIPRIAVLLKDIIFIVEKDYVTSPFVFNFEKQNPHRKIQLISSLLSPLQRILGYHSSTSLFSCDYPGLVQHCSLLSSMRDERYNTR